MLDGISLSVGRGEAVGLVGESGSGKSVTWLAALGLLPKTAAVSGSVKLEGTEILGASPSTMDRVRGGRVAMIFQDPASALNPVLTDPQAGRRKPGAASGAFGGSDPRRSQAPAGPRRYPGCRTPASAYPHELSGGQNQRIMIAMALAGNPDLLIADEPTTALDATIQAQILELIRRVRRETGMAIVLISHDLGVVAENCDRIAVMYAGRVVEEAPSAELFDDPRHPYAHGLIGSLPPIDGPRRRLTAIAGTVPDPKAMPQGCAFAPRCVHAGALCGTKPPRLRAVGENRRVACVIDRRAHATDVIGQAAE